MYLNDSMKDPKFDEFSPALQFLVTQYSALLFNPEGYTVNGENNEVKLNEDLFSSITTPETSANVNLFKDQLRLKLQHDPNIRRERRNSLSSFRSRVGSSSTKRSPSENTLSSISKSPRVHSSPPSSSKSL